MLREATAMTVRQNLGDLLNEVQYRHGKIVITKAGKPVAAMVDITLFERMRKLDEEFDRMRTEMAQAFEGMTEENTGKIINEAVRAVRKQRTMK